MAVVIRLRRTGRKNRPCFRINVTDSRFPRDGRMLETIGFYDPLRKDPAAQLVIDVERARHWVGAGAKPSEVVASMFKKRGVLEPKPAKKRERARKSAKTSKTRATRDARDERMSAAKAERRKTRVQARRAAKKAAAATAEPKA